MMQWYPAVRAAARLMVWMESDQARSKMTWDDYDAAVALLQTLLEACNDALKPIAEAEARRREA